jgi:hypothetical protein
MITSTKLRNGAIVWHQNHGQEGGQWFVKGRTCAGRDAEVKDVGPFDSRQEAIDWSIRWTVKS